MNSTVERLRTEHRTRNWVFSWGPHANELTEVLANESPKTERRKSEDEETRSRFLLESSFVMSSGVERTRFLIRVNVERLMIRYLDFKTEKWMTYWLGWSRLIIIGEVGSCWELGTCFLNHEMETGEDSGREQGREQVDLPCCMIKSHWAPWPRYLPQSPKPNLTFIIDNRNMLFLILPWISR
jgi:hypothetical protein